MIIDNLVDKILAKHEAIVKEKQTIKDIRKKCIKYTFEEFSVEVSLVAALLLGIIALVCNGEVVFGSNKRLLTSMIYFYITSFFSLCCFIFNVIKYYKYYKNRFSTPYHINRELIKL
jgi:hypothetical protein